MGAEIDNNFSLIVGGDYVYFTRAANEGAWKKALEAAERQI